MVPLASLLVPILLSAVIVFIASSVIHMVIRYHQADYDVFPNEDAVLDFVRGLNVPNGDYFAPMSRDRNAMKDPAFMEKAKRGPMIVMTIAKGYEGMGKTFIQWFVYILVVSYMTAYLASRYVQPSAEYMRVFQLVSTTSFLAYGLALPPLSIWYRKKWGTTVRSLIDAFIYSMLTAGVFSWLWPR